MPGSTRSKTRVPANAREAHLRVVRRVASALGATRVLLMHADGAGGFTVAAAKVPSGEVATSLLAAIGPWLDEASRTRRARLRHGPVGAGRGTQRSCIVAPLVGGHEVVGHLYADIDGASGRFGRVERDLLGALAEQVALADLRARDSAQRNAELAVINSIQQAVGRALDFQGIVDVVGDTLREVFATGDVSIRWWDEAADQLHCLYISEHNVKLHAAPLAPTLGTPWGPLLRKPRTVVLNSHAEQDAAGVRAAPGTDRALSIVAVPIVAGERVLGAVSLENHEREHAFGETEVRLLQTIASSMAVALLNAKSYEAERQRSAELAVINSIQQGVAGSLDFKGIVELVGDRLRTLLGYDDLVIKWHDHEAGTDYPLYAIEHGERLTFGAMPILPGGVVSQVIATGEPLLITDTAAAVAAGIVKHVAGTDMSKSIAVVPIVGGGGVIGHIGLENHVRVLGEADVSLLQTVAASMGVALENARLFDETQRLLKETEQRNAELALINGIQQGVSAKLDFQAIVMSPVPKRARSSSPTTSTMASKRNSAAMPCCTLLMTASSDERRSVSRSKRWVSSNSRAFSSATPMLAATVCSRLTSSSPSART
ncbi:MAG: GAF domain-containing protein [Caldimonas sp.]